MTHHEAARRGRPSREVVLARRVTFASDFLRALRAELARRAAADEAAHLLERRDEHAVEVAKLLDARSLAAHVRALADHFGVSRLYMRNAVANLVGRCRVREDDARDAVTRREGA
jgi:predicted hotdog family 3-hydroxylacyl-ACP dehydratase